MKIVSSQIISVFCCTRVYYLEIGDILVAMFSKSHLDDTFCQKCWFENGNGSTKLYLCPDPLCLFKTFGYSKKQYKSSESPGGHVWIVHPFQKCLKRSNSAFLPWCVF